MFRFLELHEVEELHTASLVAYGGSAGTRDPGLIESALASAINTAVYTNADVFDIAAAYAFHLAEARAFIDGNKRVAIGAALAFLALNHSMRRPQPGQIHALYDAMISLATHAMNKSDLAALFRSFFE